LQDIHTKFHKDRFRLSKVVGGGGIHTLSKGSHKPTLMFQNKERRLNICSETSVISSDC
jgi:hypothetical protein